MKVIFIADCVNCPYIRRVSDDSDAAYCDHDDIGATGYTIPTAGGIREDCPLEELGVIKEYTREGCTQTNI